jgi:epoxyqueuosine reductase
MKSTKKKNTVADKIKSFAISQGFDLVGFSPVEANAKAYKIYKNWLSKKFEADMGYMSRGDAVEKRKSAANLLKNAKTVISLAVNYYHDQPPLPKNHGRIARYAYGRDYHKILSRWLKNIEKFIRENFTLPVVTSSQAKTNNLHQTSDNITAQTLSYVDTGPILERTFAVQAGLGFIGKNCCLITKEFGSWVFLAEIVTDLPLGPSREDFFEPGEMPFPGSFPGKTFPNLKKYPSREACASCTRCIAACPTKALTIDPNTNQPTIDARKCLSYLTIEHAHLNKPLSKEAKEAINKTRRIFGCDICQEACPFSSPTHPNSKATTATHKEFLIKIAGDSLSLAEIAKIKTDKEFLKLFAGSPLMRAKKRGLKRNSRHITSP